MKEPIHPNFKKSSNLIFISAGVGLVSVLFSFLTKTGYATVLVGAISILLLFGIGFLIRIGVDWARYLFLALVYFGVVSIPFMIGDMIKNPIDAFILLGQSGLQIWAAALLFKFGTGKPE